MQASEKEFIPIRVSTLRGNQAVTFDIFVRVAGKHVLYCKVGTTFDTERLLRLKEKKVKQLFIGVESEANYRRYLMHNIENAYSKDSPEPLETRTLIVQGLQQAAAEEMIENPHNAEHYAVFKEDTKKYVEFVIRETEALKHILQIENANGSMAHHGVNVATLAACLASYTGVKEQQKLQLLVTGCLVHDLEHFHTGLNVTRPISQLTQAETDLYRQHPAHSCKRIEGYTFYDELVIKIIRHHHELINGTGFPDGLTEKQLDPLVLIASACDSYDRLISFEGLSPKEAIKKLTIDQVGLQKLEFIQGLAEILKQKKII